MPEPKFKKIKDASSPMRSNVFMLQPIMGNDGELAMAIQLIAKEKKNSRGNKNKLYAGFTNFDEVFLAIVAYFFQTKLQQILAFMAQKRVEKEVVGTIRAASVICTQRSYSDYIMNC